MMWWNLKLSKKIDKSANKEKHAQYRYVTQTRWAGRGRTKQEEEMITLMNERFFLNLWVINAIYVFNHNLEELSKKNK